MKPEINDLWEKALGYLEEAEELSKDKKFQEAMHKAIEALVAAMQAINALSSELEMPDLKEVIFGQAIKLHLEGGHFRLRTQQLEVMIRLIQYQKKD